MKHSGSICSKKILLIVSCIALIISGALLSIEYIPQKNYSIKNEESSLVYLGEYVGISYSPTVEQVSDDEINQAILYNLYSHSYTEPITDRTHVVSGDVVYYDLVICHNNDIIQVKNDICRVIGKTINFPELEEQLLKTEVGKTFKFSYIVPEDSESIYNGETLVIEGTLLSVNRLIEFDLNDDFVKSYFGVNTVSDFHDMIKSTLSASKDEEQKDYDFYSIIKVICNNSKFIINKSELNEMYEATLSKYDKIAYTYDMEIDTYVKNILNMNMGSFKKYCREECLFIIESNFVLTEICNRENFIITDAEYKAKYDEYGYSQLDLLRSPELKNDVTSIIINEKIKDFLIQVSVAETN